MQQASRARITSGASSWSEWGCHEARGTYSIIGASSAIGLGTIIMMHNFEHIMEHSSTLLITNVLKGTLTVLDEGWHSTTHGHGTSSQVRGQSVVSKSAPLESSGA